jgi:anaerobic ribonucleoside-triphosphate reductase activating protein
MSGVLRVGDRVERCTVLGPGVRAVIWVTGCRLRCRECIAPEFLDFAAGQDHPVPALADWLLGIDGIDGVTFSGGEPFEQAAALAALLDLVHARAPDLTAMAFTGYTFERLRTAGTADQRALLDRLDVLVDGPYVPRRHSDRRWLGSSNQRVRDLSGRAPLDGLDRSAGLEVVVEPGGAFRVVGVPPTRGLRAELEEHLAQLGVSVTTEESR